MKLILRRDFILLVIFFILILVELYLLDFSKNGLNPVPSDFTFRGYLFEHGPAQFWMAIYFPTIFKKVFYVFLLSLVALGITNFQRVYFWRSLLNFKFRSLSIVINLFSFGALLGILIFINDPIELINNPLSFVSLFYAFITPVLWLFYFFSIISCVFPLKTISTWAAKNSIQSWVIFAVIGLTIIPGVMEEILSFWSALLLQPTLTISLALTRGMGLDTSLLSVPGHAPFFGTSKFEVEILPSCSGYEGMALIIALLLIYCYLQREHVRVALVLLTIPFAGFAMFFLNSMRIAILIAIGDIYSPQLALEGFHVVGGWLNLLIVFVVCLFAFNYFPCFLRHPNLQKIGSRDDYPFLLPLFSIIVISFFSKVFSIGFDWLYPVPILFSALIIFYYKKSFWMIPEKISSISYIIGVIDLHP